MYIQHTAFPLFYSFSTAFDDTHCPVLKAVGNFGVLCTHSSNLFEVAEVAAHKEGSRSHEEVQHASGQDRNVWLLPQQRLEARHHRWTH